MKKSSVNKYAVKTWRNPQGKTFEYIVAHAKWQKSRGRKPSEALIVGDTLTILNPKKALEHALDYLKVVEPLPGDYVPRFVAKLIDIAKLTGNPVYTNFNGIEFHVDKTDTVDGIGMLYNSGKKHVKEQEEKLRAMQDKHNELMCEFHNLDLSNIDVVMEWLNRYQDVSDYIGSGGDVSWRNVVAELESAGYISGANCGDEFNAKDPENVKLWLVGQALSCLKSSVHAIHHMYCKFYEDTLNKNAVAVVR